jgi:nitrogen-specific signal transduction histidine kinase
MKNKVSNLYSSLIDFDLNPVLFFDNNGKILDLNIQAELLLSYVKSKVLFDIAVNNASKGFGFARHNLSLRFQKLSFCAILVGYKDEDVLCLKLYQEMKSNKEIFTKSSSKLKNIFTIIDLSKKSSLMHSKVSISEVYDTSIPEVKVDVGKFLFVLNGIFEAFINHKKITLKVFIDTGRHKMLEGKKCKIVIIEFIYTQDSIALFDDNFLKHASPNINIFQESNTILIEIPIF